MIGFGCVVSSEDEYRQYALPGIERVTAPGDEVVVLRGRDCIYKAYNDILARLGGRPDLEAVVLVHQDVEIVDDDFRVKVLEAMGRPAAGVAGVIGGIGDEEHGLVGGRARDRLGAVGVAARRRGAAAASSTTRRSSSFTRSGASARSTASTG